MPLTLNVGLSKKIGLPDYGSLGVSCNVQVELDSTLLHSDLDGFHEKVKRAYIACHQAVTDELAHQHHEGAGSQHANGHLPARSGPEHPDNGIGNDRTNRQRRSVRKATAGQVRAIQSIADRLQLDLASWLHQKHGLSAAAELSISDASAAIDELKVLSTNNGVHY